MSKYDITFKTLWDVCETVPTGEIVRGTFLPLDVPSRNKRIYPSRTEAENIAETLIGRPVYWGTTVTNRHDKRRAVGRVIEAVYNRVKNIIEGAVEITDKTIAETIRRLGRVGFSLGGKARDLITRAADGLREVVGMVADHLQLFPITTPRGFEVAQGIPTEESFSYFEIEESADPLEEKKENLRKYLTATGYLDSAHVDDLVNGVQTEADISGIRNVYNSMALSFNQGQNREPAKTGGAQNPPRSVVRLPSAEPEYKDPIAARYRGDDWSVIISRLYEDQGNSDPRIRDYAKNTLDRLWVKAGDFMLQRFREGKPILAHELVACPGCGKMLQKGAYDHCIYCGLPIRDSRGAGLEV